LRRLQEITDSRILPRELRLAFRRYEGKGCGVRVGGSVAGEHETCVTGANKAPPRPPPPPPPLPPPLFSGRYRCNFGESAGPTSQHTLWVGLATHVSAGSSQPSTLNPHRYTLTPQPSDLTLEPSALSPQPSALSPQPSALNPQPSALDHATAARPPRCRMMASATSCLHSSQLSEVAFAGTCLLRSLIKLSPPSSSCRVQVRGSGTG
jgi:hypothetical protein